MTELLRAEASPASGGRAVIGFEGSKAMASNVLNVTRDELIRRWEAICLEHGIPSSEVNDFVASHELTQAQYLAVEELRNIELLLDEGRLNLDLLG